MKRKESKHELKKRVNESVEIKQESFWESDRSFLFVVKVSWVLLAQCLNTKFQWMKKWKIRFGRVGKRKTLSNQITAEKWKINHHHFSVWWRVMILQEKLIFEFVLITQTEWMVDCFAVNVCLLLGRQTN